MFDVESGGMQGRSFDVEFSLGQPHQTTWASWRRWTGLGMIFDSFYNCRVAHRLSLCNFDGNVTVIFQRTGVYLGI